MANVTADQVRKRLGLTPTDIKDEDVMAFVAEATAWLSNEIGRNLNHANCTETEANSICNLVAIYCYCYVTGGVAVSLDFSIGELGGFRSSHKTNSLSRGSLKTLPILL